MRLDLTQLMNKRIPSLHFDFFLSMDDVEDAPQLPDDIALCAPIHVVGDVIDNDGYMALRAKVNADYATV